MSTSSYGQLPFTLAQGAEESGQIAVAFVYWLNPTNVGDTFKLVDSKGNTAFTGRCEVASQSQLFDFSGAPIKMNGISMNQLSSGTMYIYPAVL
jgi:hypothetical protein